MPKLHNKNNQLHEYLILRTGLIFNVTGFYAALKRNIVQARAGHAFFER